MKLWYKQKVLSIVNMHDTVLSHYETQPLGQIYVSIMKYSGLFLKPQQTYICLKRLKLFVQAKVLMKGVVSVLF